MSEQVQPTTRELAILKILWDLKEASVRQVYEALRDELPIVQNTVQAFLRTMEQKGLVTHRRDGRTFIYKATRGRSSTERRLLSSLLDRVFDGAVDQLVASALSLRRPSAAELTRLKGLVDAAQPRAEREKQG